MRSQVTFYERPFYFAALHLGQQHIVGHFANAMDEDALRPCTWSFGMLSDSMLSAICCASCKSISVNTDFPLKTSFAMSSVKGIVHVDGE